MAEEPSRAVGVLIVDCNPGSRRALEDLLAGEGYAVSRAADAVRAIRRFDAEQPAVVLIDVDMPDRGADIVIAHVRAAAPRVPIVVVTEGHPDDAAAERQRWRADVVLNKPLELRQITTTVQAVLDARSPS